ncbi:AIPR family protein [Lentzea sp. NPDC034063]|uniref:AIPR family protein n=1 Tax=unclassified Lentzea TaxID=2643253 RepID=UPI0033F88E8B
MTTALQVALAERTDLDQYGSAKRALFALQMSLDIEDIHSVAATALTDGPDDKSCDVIYVDRDSRSVVLVQGYESGSPDSKVQAPQGKAASLHQAVNWLFGAQQVSDVPMRLQSAWRELHDALDDDAIDGVEIWFVHNLPESSQIRDELAAVATAAHGIVASRHPGRSVNFIGKELGQETLEDRYKGSQTPILVTDKFQIEVAGSFVESGDTWSAVCTSVPAQWLRDVFSVHQDRLFSANIRGYLGSRKSQNNINNGIQETAEKTPARFWAYNNGITAIVHKFEQPSSDVVEITGLAIVNGAQTTGALGSAKSSSVSDGRLMARFIKCEDAATVREIIRYNNRQNPTEASDFRSNDRIQTRLVKEFEKLGVAGYSGGRRGGAEDVIRRPGENQISASVAAQALAAFHGRPEVAYHEKGQIWESDSVYGATFPERTDARHIMFVYSLLKTVEQYKIKLGTKAEDSRTSAEKSLVAWFSLRGSIFLAVSAVSNAMEELLNYAVTDRYALKFSNSYTVAEAMIVWQPVASAMLKLAPSLLTDPLKGVGGLRNRPTVENALLSYRGIVDATKDVNSAIYEPFASLVEKK